jgi:hypothetical protein
MSTFQDNFKARERRERVATCWQLRKEGNEPAAIAEQMGLTVALVRTYLAEAIAVWKAAYEAEARDLALLDLARTEEVIRYSWPKVRQGNDKAAQVVLRALERRARMLGIDKATRVEVANGASLAEIRAKLTAALPEGIGPVSFMPGPVPEVPCTDESLLPDRNQVTIDGDDGDQADEDESLDYRPGKL